MENSIRLMDKFNDKINAKVRDFSDEPHAKRTGWLKNGNPPGDPQKAPRCRARTRSKTACKAPGMRNGRCRAHPPKGLKRSRSARWRHGQYSSLVRWQH